MSRKMTGVIVTAGSENEADIVKIIEALSRPLAGLALDGIRVSMQIGQGDIDE